jgi:hypothetical protein
VFTVFSYKKAKGLLPRNTKAFRSIERACVLCVCVCVCVCVCARARVFFSSVLLAIYCYNNVTKNAPYCIKLYRVLKKNAFAKMCHLPQECYNPRLPFPYKCNLYVLVQDQIHMFSVLYCPYASTIRITPSTG